MWKGMWGAEVFIWLRSKEKKGKGFNQTFQESNVGVDWW